MPDQGILDAIPEWPLLVLAPIVLLYTLSWIKILKEYERGVVFRLGRSIGVKGKPGFNYILPLIDKMVKVDIRNLSVDLSKVEMVTKDHAAVAVSVTVYFHVINPEDAVLTQLRDSPKIFVYNQ